ncbi:GNAT family N-acetyltransferase [uncultured Ruminococcus sp.]|uniref:GNAT family N-acetyltransferase n=1 Tax=uncultured Ruminococcus sp. TaxID=165186 RepID=UPI0026601EAE|nr:GNAT family N-acetyltransferase [uncultured Ruminococcus sp.]
MTIYEVPECSDSLLQTILTIWEASVRATHHFLSDAEIVRIREYVPQAVRAVEHLVLAEDASGTAVAFLGAEGHRLEMLFLSPSERGKGIGRQLLQYGVQHYGIREVTVNEQNLQAAGFYEHLGFETYRRTDCDENGDPYPLLYMKLVR